VSPVYERFMWEEAQVEFIGYLTKTSSTRYQLQEKYEDKYAVGKSRPWYVDPELKCKKAFEVP